MSMLLGDVLKSEEEVLISTTASGRDSRPRTLFLTTLGRHRVNVQLLYSQTSPGVAVYGSVWGINDTDIPVEVATRLPGSGAGQLIPPKTQRYLLAQPLDEKRPLAWAKVRGESAWSAHFPIGYSDGGHVECGRRDSVTIMAYTVTEMPADAGLTPPKLLRFMPRWVFLNRTPWRLQLRHSAPDGPPTELEVGPSTGTGSGSGTSMGDGGVAGVAALCTVAAGSCFLSVCLPEGQAQWSERFPADTAAQFALKLWYVQTPEGHDVHPLFSSTPRSGSGSGSVFDTLSSTPDVAPLARSVSRMLRSDVLFGAPEEAFAAPQVCGCGHRTRCHALDVQEVGDKDKGRGPFCSGRGLRRDPGARYPRKGHDKRETSSACAAPTTIDCSHQSRIVFVGSVSLPLIPVFCDERTCLHRMCHDLSPTPPNPGPIPLIHPDL